MRTRSKLISFIKVSIHTMRSLICSSLLQDTPHRKLSFNWLCCWQWNVRSNNIPLTFSDVGYLSWHAVQKTINILPLYIGFLWINRFLFNSRSVTAFGIGIILFLTIIEYEICYLISRFTNTKFKNSTNIHKLNIHLSHTNNGTQIMIIIIKKNISGTVSKSNRKLVARQNWYP